MTQGREPPAYQEYAAEMLSDGKFREMNLVERGLLYTLKLECWKNRTLPADPARLAKVLGLDKGEVANALPQVMDGFLEEIKGRLSYPELETYRAHLALRRERMAEGGKRGAQAKKRKGNASKTHAGGAASEATPEAPLEPPSSHPEATLKPPSRVLVKSSSEKQSQKLVPGGISSCAALADAYGAADCDERPLENSDDAYVEIEI